MQSDQLLNMAAHDVYSYRCSSSPCDWPVNILEARWREREHLFMNHVYIRKREDKSFRCVQRCKTIATRGGIVLIVSSEFSAFQPSSVWYSPCAGDRPFEFNLRVLRVTNYDRLDARIRNEL